MTLPEAILHYTLWLAFAVLAVSFLLTVWRVIQGPTLPDRVLALDMLVGIAIGFIALIAIRTGFTLYIDIAISLGLVGFLATVAFARFILSRGERQDTDPAATPRSPSPAAAQTPRRKTPGKRKAGAAAAARKGTK